MILTAIIPRFLAAFGLVIGFGVAENALAQSNPIAPKILEPIEFAAYTVSQINSPSAVSNLLDLKISISPGIDSTGCKILCKGAGNYVETETINQYRAALSAGYSPYTTYDISIESWFKKVDAILAFMDKAQASTNSLLNKSFLKKLPPFFMDTVGTCPSNHIVRLI